MDRWNGKVAVVTGGSAGIGAAIAKDLVAHGVKVAALARRIEKLKELESELSEQPGQFRGLQCDLTKEEDIMKAFKWVEDNWGAVHILVNNAAVLIASSVQDIVFDDFSKMFQTNVVSMTTCIKEGLKSMKTHGIKNGHIININSVCGHSVLPFPGIAPYSATKHCMTVLTKSLRNELAAEKSSIRVTSLSPGSVKSEMSDEFLKDIPEKPLILAAEDVSRAVVYVLSTPPNVNISEMLMEAI